MQQTMTTPAEHHTAMEDDDRSAQARPHLVKSILQELLARDHRTDSTVVLPSTTLGYSGTVEYRNQAQAFAELSAALLQSRWLEALALCQRILRHAKEPLTPSLHANIAELRHSIEQQLLVRSTLDFVSDLHRIRLLPRRSILIGRPGGEMPADIAIDCRWLSRADRNLSLACNGGNWFLEDLGSTNGNFVNGSRLAPGMPCALPIGQTQIQIGRSGDTVPVTLELRRPVKDPNSVIVSLRHTGSTLATAASWPTVQQDLAMRWVVFRTQIGIAAEEDCALRVEGTGPGVGAAIRYQNGFWVVPGGGARVGINDSEFEGTAPIPRGSTLRIAMAKFRVETPADSEAEAVSAGGQT
ncbi:MAG: FHA domain-containing protein [Alphaproteobacteria bacterium]|nr:FHA domain-containing protein [Alphaproteobacteria bacterium]